MSSKSVVSSTSRAVPPPSPARASDDSQSSASTIYESCEVLPDGVTAVLPSASDIKELFLRQKKSPSFFKLEFVLSAVVQRPDLRVLVSPEESSLVLGRYAQLPLGARGLFARLREEAERESLCAREDDDESVVGGGWLRAAAARGWEEAPRSDGALRDALEVLENCGFVKCHRRGSGGRSGGGDDGRGGGRGGRGAGGGAGFGGLGGSAGAGGGGAAGLMVLGGGGWNTNGGGAGVGATFGGRGGPGGGVVFGGFGGGGAPGSGGIAGFGGLGGGGWNTGGGLAGFGGVGGGGPGLVFGGFGGGAGRGGGGGGGAAGFGGPGGGGLNGGAPLGGVGGFGDVSRDGEGGRAWGAGHSLKRPRSSEGAGDGGAGSWYCHCCATRNSQGARECSDCGVGRLAPPGCAAAWLGDYLVDDDDDIAVVDVEPGGAVPSVAWGVFGDAGGRDRVRCLPPLGVPVDAATHNFAALQHSQGACGGEDVSAGGWAHAAGSGGAFAHSRAVPSSAPPASDESVCGIAMVRVDPDVSVRVIAGSARRARLCFRVVWMRVRVSSFACL